MHWLDLQEIKREPGLTQYEEVIHLKCPKCKEGVIKRDKDHTPGFKCSDIHPCDKCGFKLEE